MSADVTIVPVTIVTGNDRTNRTDRILMKYATMVKISSKAIIVIGTNAIKRIVEDNALFA